ncbi:hypothetical protein [Flagellimonas zhangzhouensis]|uniref:Uncharacterized protein n=1 Tax=Flagellimonas zhangzhouensis TaxID=1073328 RepID=A0A1H2Q591_9FLAO|nr:hypothetical protein [Allomuricauda zhangzhouensis]SDQ48525.1 hypothetical protein SAMN05216294_1420 [Allomuricauda zhangzhouensis]SDW02265.1 hypothetical protein SAMN04487892_0071 [Allomuricauda zhangzhouensis]
MKSIYKFLLATLIVAIGCEDSDLPIDTILYDVGRGVALRQVNLVSNEYPIGDYDAALEVQLEVQDSKGIVTEMNVYGTFDDDADTFDIDDQLIQTFPIGDFETSQYGLPTMLYILTQGDAISLLGLTEDQVGPFDSFTFRFELVTSDGRTFSAEDNTGTLTGTFYSSPFSYDVLITCPPKAPTAGVWTIEMHDSYGDGWQTTDANGGDGVTVTLDDGTVIEFGMCSPYSAAAGTFLGSGDCIPNDGSDATATITIPAGTETATWYFPGDNWGEISMEIYTPNGNLVGSVATSMPAGEIAIDFCYD